MYHISIVSSAEAKSFQKVEVHHPNPLFPASGSLNPVTSKRSRYSVFVTSREHHSKPGATKY
jgi:hypothetical protein